MKIKIYRSESSLTTKHVGLFYVFVEEKNGFYRMYDRYFINPNQISYKLKKKKLSIKYITKLFIKLNIRYNEMGLDHYIKTYDMTHLVSYESKNISSH